MIPLMLDDILCIIALIGALIFSIIKKEHVLLIASLFLITITQFQTGRIDGIITNLPNLKVKGTMSTFYDFSLNLGRQIYDDLVKVNGITYETLILLIILGQRNHYKKYMHSKSRKIIKLVVLLSALFIGLSYLAIFMEKHIIDSMIMGYIDIEQLDTILLMSQEIIRYSHNKLTINILFLLSIFIYLLENRSFSSLTTFLIMAPLKIIHLLNMTSQIYSSVKIIDTTKIKEMIPFIHDISNLLIYSGFTLIFFCWIMIILSYLIKGKTKVSERDALKKKNDDISEEDKEEIPNDFDVSLGYTESKSEDTVQELDYEKTSTRSTFIHNKNNNISPSTNHKHSSPNLTKLSPNIPKLSTISNNISPKLTHLPPKNMRESNLKMNAKSKLKAPSKINLINKTKVNPKKPQLTSNITKETTKETHQEVKFRKRSISDLSKIEILQSLRKVPSVYPLNKTSIILYFTVDYNTMLLKDIERDEVLFEMNGHKDAISSIKFYDQNRYLVSSSFDKSVRIWDINSRTLKHTILDYNSEITCLYINHTNKLIITGSVDGEIKVWSIETSSFIATVNANTYISSIILTDDYKILSVLRNHTIVVWNMKSGEVESTFHGNYRISDCIYLHNSNQIISSDDHTIKIWNLNSKECERTLTSTRGSISSFVSISETELVVGTDDGYIIIWNTQTGEIISEVKGHEGSVINIFKESQNNIITYGMDSKLSIRDLNDLNVIDTKIIHHEIENKISKNKEKLKVNILVATNDEDTLESIKTTLSNLGYDDVISVNNVENLKLSLSNNRIHLLFLDLMIYEIDTVEDYLLPSIGNRSNDFFVSIIKSNELWFLDIYELFENVNYNVDVIHKPITSLDVDKALKEVEERISLKERNHQIEESSTNLLFKKYEESVKNYIDNYYQDLIPSKTSDFRSNPTTCRTTTTLYCNIQDFSELTSNMSVNDLMEFINGYYAFTVTPIIEYGGNVDKFFGDATLSVFTHNIDDNCVSAIKCAVNIQQNVNFINKNSKEKINTTIGIHTEKSVIGFVCIQKFIEPAILGDAYGISVRLEALCKVYSSKIIITEYTKENMGNDADLFILRELDYVAVKGLKNPCRIYEVIDGENPDILNYKKRILEEGNWNEALSVYQSGDFEKAKEMFENCLKIYSDDQPSKLYIERCNICLRESKDNSTVIEDDNPISKEISEWDAMFNE